MDLLERFMEGLELRDPARVDPRPLDFAASNERGTLLFLTNWWTIEWGMNAGLLYVPAVLNPKTLWFDGLEASGWHLAGATDGFFESHLHGARLHADFNRESYHDALLRLVEFEPDFDFRPWIEAVLARPRLDPFEMLRIRHMGLRSVGVIRLLDGAGAVADALAVDDKGQAVTLVDDGWLALFASQWSGYAEAARPDVGSFLGWVAQQTPYGPLALSEPKVISEEGEIRTVLDRALAQNPA